MNKVESTMEEERNDENGENRKLTESDRLEKPSWSRNGQGDKGGRGNYKRMQALWKHVDAMHMMPWDEMHDMNKKQNKKKQKPNHEGIIISHLRKRQELELRIWKVVSGALQHSTTTRGSRPEI